MFTFHPASYLIGFISAVGVMATRERLRPVLVELGVLGVHFWHVSRAVIERQREHAEDLAAEIEEKARERTRRGGRKARASAESAVH